VKILFHHRIASRDGQAVHLEELIEALRGQGHEVVLVGPASFESSGFGGEIGFVAMLKRLLPAAVYELMEFAYNVPAARRLDAAVRTHKPDVIYERYSLLLAAGIWIHRRRKIPLLLEVNGPLFEERVKNDGLALHGLGRWCQRFEWNGADFVLPVTDVLAGYVRRYGVPESRIAVIPNGINTARFGHAPRDDEAKAALGMAGRLVLGFTGFIRAWHRLDRVIDFVAAHGERLNLHLLIVGDGPVRAELEAHAKSRGVAQRFTITGVVERDAVVRHVAAFDIALQPGITEYASPLKLFEYMYLGRAVVAPDMANIREILTHERDALLFDEHSPDAMNAAILRLAEDAALRGRLGAQARRTMDEKGLTWENNARRVVALAERAIAANRGGRP
jgi:glycosyltransferase involved in cell wall biosynthesis